MRLLNFMFCATLLGCGAPTEDTVRGPFDALEARLLAAENVSFTFQVISEGVITGNLQGTVSASSSGALTIDAYGTFIERELQMQLVTTADSLRMVTNEMSDAVARQDETFSAVVLGLTRMGIMHNLAQLSTVSPPDHGDVGMDDWVAVDNFGNAPVGEYTGMSFDLFVDGEKTSSAILAVEDGLPVRRRQEVAFPGGSMIVTETYSDFVVTGGN
ncbi:MAG: hypothetical protein ACI84D_001267 [Thalassolituus oleivorans]|jgi:hypothetical protein